MQLITSSEVHVRGSVLRSGLTLKIVNKARDRILTWGQDVDGVEGISLAYTLNVLNSYGRLKRREVFYM